MKKTCIGIDASRNRSGGAIHHLVGILEAGDPASHGIGPVHVWAYRALLDLLPDEPWLIKHNPPELERPLLHQMRWQRWMLPGEARQQGVELLLSPDAGTVGVFEPSVVMSRDMLSYEPGEMKRYGVSKAWFRLMLLRHVQARSLKRARGAVFLTQYASDTIQRFTGPLRNVAVIPHGIGEDFRQPALESPWPRVPGGAIRCLYVSNAELYKHQWQVVRAVGELRKQGHDVELTLVGGGHGRAQDLVDDEIKRMDPDGKFVRLAGAVKHDRLPMLLAASDLFVFASSCENMPNTLLEGMASGLPIACSNRGPMPEVLEDGGVYFDPESPQEIAAALYSLIADPALRVSVVRRAKARSERFSWARCALETWKFLRANADADNQALSANV